MFPILEELFHLATKREGYLAVEKAPGTEGVHIQLFESLERMNSSGWQYPLTVRNGAKLTNDAAIRRVFEEESKATGKSRIAIPVTYRTTQGGDLNLFPIIQREFISSKDKRNPFKVSIRIPFIGGSC